MPASPPQGSGGGGGSVSWDIDQLEEIIAALLPANLFGYKGIYPESSIDSIILNGIYEIEGTAHYLLTVFADEGSTTRIVQVRYYPDGSIEWRNQTDGTTWSAWRDIWTSASDGTGSGLDADLLDGNHAAAFATSGHNHDGTYSPTGHNHDGTYSPTGHNHDGTYSPVGHNHDSDYADIAHTHALDDLTDVVISNPATGQCLVYSGTGWVNGGGTGSGLDADLLDGSHASAFASSGHNHDLDSLSDVVITTPIDGQILKRVSGTWVNASGGGSDADTLDGYHASSFVLASDYEDSDVLAKIKNVDGTGSGLDADTIDGSHASSFASSSHTHGLDDLTDVEISNPASGQFLKYDGSKWGNSALGTVDADTLDGSHASAFAASGHNHDSDYVKLTDYEDADVLTKIKNVDGNTSGLDADLLDGYHSSSFAASGHNHDGTYAASVHNHDGTYSPVGHLHDDRYVLTSDYEDSDVLTKIKNVDGTGSGLDADTLDGNEATAFAAASHAHTQYELNTIPSEILTTTAPGWFRILHSSTTTFNEPLELMVRVRSSDYRYYALYKFLIFTQNHQDNSDAAQIILLGGFRNNEAGYTGFDHIRVKTNTTGSGTAYVDIHLNEDLYVTTYILSRNTAQWVAYDFINEIDSLPPEPGVTTVSLDIQTDGIATSGKIYSGGTEVSLSSHAHALDNLTDVVISTPSTNQVLKFNGTNWVNDTGPTGDATTLDGLDSTDFARYKAVTTTVGAASAGWYRIAESTTYLVLRNPFSIAWGATGVSHGNVTLVPQQSFEQGILLTQLAFSVYHNTGYGITQARLVYSDTGTDKSFLEIYSDGIANYDLYVSEMMYWNNWTVYATPTAGSVPSGYSAATITFAGAINSTGKLYSEGTEVSKTGHAHAGSDVTSGTIDGDRLPAMSSSKKGGVPATGTPSGLFLKDDGTWASAGGGGTGAARLSTVYKSVTFNTSSNDDTVTDSVDLGTSYGTITRIRVYADKTMGQRTPGQFLVNNASGIGPSDTSLAYDSLTGTLPTAGAEGTGDYIWIDNELIRVASGTSTPLTVVRGLGGTRAAFHDDNSVIRTANDGLRLALFNSNSYVFTNAFLEISNLLTGYFTTNAAISAGANYLVCTTSPAVLSDFGLGDCILIDDTSDEYAYVQAVLGAVAGTTYDNAIFTRDTLSAHDNTKPVYRVIEYNQPITFKLSDGDDLLYFSLAANQLLPGNMTVYLEFLVEKWD